MDGAAWVAFSDSEERNADDLIEAVSRVGGAMDHPFEADVEEWSEDALL